jgi:parallel beta-helix repeat protein
MSKLKKYLLPLVTGVITLCLILGMLSGCAPAATTDAQQDSPSLGEILDPSGNPFVNRFSDEKDIRTATFVVAASDSDHRYDCDLRCDGTADDVQINAALTAGAGGKVVLLEGNYQITANIVVPASTHFSGMGKGTILTTTDAVGITNMVVINGNNVTISDMKLVLGAGAGDAGTRPNVIYADTRTNLLLENLWIYGDQTVADDAALARQNGIYFTATTDSKVINCIVENNKKSGINLAGSSDSNLVSGNRITACVSAGIEVRGSEYNNAVANRCYANLTGIANYTDADYNTYVGNTCIGNTTSGIYLNAGVHNQAVGNTCNVNGIGISCTTATYSNITGNACDNNTGNGIILTADYATVTGNMIWSAGGTNPAIEATSVDYCIVSGNSCFGTGAGISCSAMTNSAITGNIVQGGVGIKISGASHDNTITGNTCSDSPAGNGIVVQSSDYNTVSGNTVENNADKGIYIYRSSYNTVSGNTSTNNSEGIYVKGDGTANADYNFVTSNSCRGNTYNLDISGGADCNHTRMIDNETSDSVYLLIDNGFDTELNSVIVPFSDGTDAQDSGYLIDLNADTARAWLILPLEVQVVMKLKIYARAVDASGTTMALEINVNGGASDEAFTTHATAAPDTPTTTSNFAADDVIFWELSSAEIVALNAGDSIQVVVLHEAANGGGIETDAYIRTVEIEYQ